jgi:hypothetical protein
LKKLKTTGTYPLNTTDFIPSNKVDVDTALLEKVQSEDVKAEKKRAKEAREAKDNETSEGRQNTIEEANRIAKQLREKRKKDEKDEKHRLLLQRKEMAKERAKERKEERKRVKEEEKAALALAALEVPRQKGVCWDRSHCCWKVQLSAHGKKWHLLSSASSSVLAMLVCLLYTATAFVWSSKPKHPRCHFFPRADNSI